MTVHGVYTAAAVAGESQAASPYTPGLIVPFTAWLTRLKVFATVTDLGGVQRVPKNAVASISSPGPANDMIHSARANDVTMSANSVDQPHVVRVMNQNGSTPEHLWKEGEVLLSPNIQYAFVVQVIDTLVGTDAVQILWEYEYRRVTFDYNPGT